MSDQQTTTTKQPVVIRHGGNGLSSVIAALILAAAAVYAINVWSTTKKETSPAKSIEQGIERIKDAAAKAIERLTSSFVNGVGVMLRAGLPQETPAFSFDSEPLEFTSLDSPA